MYYSFINNNWYLGDDFVDDAKNEEMVRESEKVIISPLRDITLECSFFINPFSIKNTIDNNRNIILSMYDNEEFFSYMIDNYPEHVIINHNKVPLIISPAFKKSYTKNLKKIEDKEIKYIINK